MTFGQPIAQARKQASLSQKDLALQIRKEDGSPISPQYLNDLERDRRNPPSEHFLKQFAQVLHIPDDYVFFMAGQWPEDLRHPDGTPRQPDEVVAAFRAFCRVLHEGAVDEVDS